MKHSHNKKRNTAFIFEALIKELTKASMNKDADRKNKCLSIIKEFFKKGSVLKKDLEIYDSLSQVDDLDQVTIEKIVQESKLQFKRLNREKVFNQQSRLINIINKVLGESVWDNFTVKYKKLATINQVLEQQKNPKSQVLVESKLVSMLCATETKTPFPNVNNLAVKTFIEKFNEQYSENLSESQKSFLSKYIQTNGEDSVDFKVYVYQEIDKIKSFLNENIQNYDGALAENVKKVVDKVSKFNTKKFDDEFVFDVLRIQTLVEKLEHNG